MSMSRRQRQRRRATIAGAAIGIMIIFTFVIGLINPDLGRNRNNNDPLPTFTPYGTPPPPTQIIVPTPDPDPQLAGELPYIHSSGLFQTFRPAGDDWTYDDRPAVDNASRLSVVIQSPNRLVVIHNYIQRGVDAAVIQILPSMFQNRRTFGEALGEISRLGKRLKTRIAFAAACT